MQYANLFYKIAPLFLFLTCNLSAIQRPSDNQLRVLYNRLDPRSVSQHLAFYDLYSYHPQGQQALSDAWKLLLGSGTPTYIEPSSIPQLPAISSLIALINKDGSQQPPFLSETDLAAMEPLSRRLKHYYLKGHNATTIAELVPLPTEQIDLGRGIFLSQFGSDLYKVKLYETVLDMMALQILARLPSKATDEDKIRALNEFIFDEMRFRFPPKSIHKKNIDIYTCLPAVLDSHRGVCLGVSILYLCLAQRIDLPLEVVTPPGHIYIRYKNGEKEINIETTARGIHVDSDEYLNIDTRALQLRTIKEVIGLSHMNQAGYYLQREEFDNALEEYKKAAVFVPDDSLLTELRGYVYIAAGNNEEGLRLLAKIKDHIPEYAIGKNTTAEDCLLGNANSECIKSLFSQPEENRQSLLTKKDSLEMIVKKYPRFRAGLIQLSMIWLQLQKLQNALFYLNEYVKLSPDDAEAQYYLTMINIERKDYGKAWEHLRNTERLVHARDYDPKPLKDLRKQLAVTFPE